MSDSVDLAPAVCVFVTFSVYKRRRLLDLTAQRIVLGVLNHLLDSGGSMRGFRLADHVTRWCAA